jgi:hypothetical protein
MGSPDFVRYADVDHRPRALAQLELAKEQLKQTVVRAPRAGRVLRIQASPGEVTGPKPILQLGDTRRMYVVAEVDEGQIPFVEKGQEATIKCLDLRASTYTGKVESRALMVLKNDILGPDPAAAAYARVVEVKIKVDEPCDPLRDLSKRPARAPNARSRPGPVRRMRLRTRCSSTRPTSTHLLPWIRGVLVFPLDRSSRERTRPILRNLTVVRTTRRGRFMRGWPSWLPRIRRAF